MARTRKVIEHDAYDEEIVEAEFVSTESEHTAHDEAAANFFEKLQSPEREKTILIKKQLTDGRSKMAHVAEYPVDQYTWNELLEHLRRTFGGGAYRFQLRWGGRIRANTLEEIAEPLKSEVQTSENGQWQTVLQTIERLQNRVMELASAKSGDDEEERILNKMEKYKNIFSNSGGSGGLGGITEALKLFETLGIKLENGSRGGDGLAAFAPTIEKLIDKIDLTQVSASAPQNQPLEQQKMLTESFLLHELARLERAAIRGSDPAAYALVILDQIPEEKIRQFFASPNGLEMIYMQKQGLRNYAPWFEALAEHVKAHLGMPSTVADQYDDNLTPDEQSNITAAHGPTDSPEI